MKVIIDGKEIEIELELTEEQKTVVERALRHLTGWGVSRNGTDYYRIGAMGCNVEVDTSSKLDKNMYERANYFSSEELAENIDRAQTLQRKLWRRSVELCEKKDWGENKDLYSISYDYEKHRFFLYNRYYIRDFGQVYFDTKAHAEQVVEEFRDELTWYFTKFRERMD